MQPLIKPAHPTTACDTSTGRSRANGGITDRAERRCRRQPVSILRTTLLAGMGLLPVMSLSGHISCRYAQRSAGQSARLPTAAGWCCVRQHIRCRRRPWPWRDWRYALTTDLCKSNVWETCRVTILSSVKIDFRPRCQMRTISPSRTSSVQKSSMSDSPDVVRKRSKMAVFSIAITTLSSRLPHFSGILEAVYTISSTATNCCCLAGGLRYQRFCPSFMQFAIDEGA